MVLDSEPGPVRLIDRDELEPMARTFGSLADLKSPWLYGHSAAVGDLAAAAAGSIQAYDQVADLRIAGYLHDLGRVGVSSRIWDKPGPLSQTERDQARLHPYHSERILSRIPELSRLAMLVGQHHERSDGTGYHRGLTSVQLTMPVAHSRCCRLVPLPGRGAPPQAVSERVRGRHRLQAQARAGELDADAVLAVLSAGGLRRGQRTIRPAGLTERQVEVLRLVAVGSSNRDIAERLVISTRTAEHHVQDIYLKIGARRGLVRRSTRWSTGCSTEPG